MSDHGDEKETTLIQVSKGTAKRLKALGIKGETYEAIISRLIFVYKGRAK